MSQGQPVSRPTDTEPVRIDRWLWSVRVFRTRADASRACRGGHVEVDGRVVKPAHRVGVGDKVVARVGRRVRELEVVATIDSRVGAPIAATCYVDLRPPEPPKDPQAAFGVRDKGAGRPTKRERRQHDRHFGRGR